MPCKRPLHIAFCSFANGILQFCKLHFVTQNSSKSEWKGLLTRCYGTFSTYCATIPCRPLPFTMPALLAMYSNLYTKEFMKLPALCFCPSSHRFFTSAKGFTAILCHPRICRQSNLLFKCPGPTPNPAKP